jgi:hypothetical protein
MLPARNDPRWGRLVEQPTQFSYTFLALKILMQRISRKAAAVGGEREAVVDEVYAFFEQNQSLMGDDIAVIFG